MMYSVFNTARKGSTYRVVVTKTKFTGNPVSLMKHERDDYIMLQPPEQGVEVIPYRRREG
jgi:hypothetical protein